MRRKIVTVILSIIAALCLCLGMAACTGKKVPETETWTIEQVYARAQELGFEGTLEELIAQFKGDDGKDGKDGIGIKQMYINTDGELIVVLTEGDPVNLGTVRGKDGKDGKDGKSAFDIWKETYGDENSTEEDFLEWLRGSSESTEDGLQYTLNPDNKTYSVTDIGTYNKIDLIIPAQHAGMPVTEIAENVFKSNQWIRSVTIPNTIKKIGMNAFENCSGLTKVIISDFAAWCNIDFDGYNSNPLYCAPHLYLGDTELKELDIPADVTRIAPRAFCHGTGITSIKISDSVTSIGEAAFYGCSAEILWGEHPAIKEIGEDAFYGYRGTSFTIPDSVTSIGGRAFEGCSAEIVWGEHPTIQEIGGSAFSGYNGTSIAIPASVTKIGWGAFWNCTSLERVNITDLAAWCRIDFADIDADPVRCAQHLYVNGNLLTELQIPAGITEIKNYTFQNCLGLERLVIGEGVTRVGELAFRDCFDLTDITLGEDLTTIADWGFIGCPMASITIPASVTSIGTGALGNANNLVSIEVEDGNPVYHADGNCLIETQTGDMIAGCKTSVIPKDGSVTAIHPYAFAYCRVLSSIEIPDTVTSIGEAAFIECEALTEVVIPDSVTSIGSYAFQRCKELESVTLPESVTSIGERAFDETPYYETNGEWDGDGRYLGNWLVEVRSTVSGNYSIRANTKGIAGRAFSYRSNLTSIEIPDSVISIGEYAFEGCSAEIIWGAHPTIKEIGSYAFRYYNGTSIVIPDSVISIGEYAFGECYGLTSIVIPDGVTSIGEYAFTFCNELKTVTFGSNVSTIGEYAFGGCIGLTSLALPASLTSIGEYALVHCSGLESITVAGENPKYHSDGNCLIETATHALLLGCNNSVIPIDGSVTKIGDWAFNGISGLTSLAIPASITLIEVGAFYGCGGLESITVLSGNPKYHSNGNCLIETATHTLLLGCKNSVIPQDGSVTKIGDYAFDGVSGLTSIEIPACVTSIGRAAFDECNGLTSIVIPDSVTSIGAWAFANCSKLASVVVPDSVTSIGEYAFAYCDGLEIHFNGSIDKWNGIEKDADWDAYAGEFTITCTDGAIDKDGTEHRNQE